MRLLSRKTNDEKFCSMPCLYCSILVWPKVVAANLEGGSGVDRGVKQVHSFDVYVYLLSTGV